MLKQLSLCLTMVLILLTGPAAGDASAQDRPAPEKEMVDGDPMVTLGPVGVIPAIEDPVFVTAAAADAWMADEELVFGLIGPDGETRAYSAWHLDRHEIVNDHLGEVPIAVTW